VEKLKRRIRHKERKLQKSADRARHRASFHETEIIDSKEACAPLQHRSINAVPPVQTDPVKASTTGSQQGAPPSVVPKAVNEASLAFAAGSEAAPPAEPRLKHTVQLKVLVVGDTKCGKTSIIHRYAHVSSHTSATRPSHRLTCESAQVLTNASFLLSSLAG